ncbi:MAG: outer membrane protein assembly factor BamC [Porticoccaceae bacterium]|jgi:outer membrane protein assembly factor BamC|nr:outer membrane protein assembly factor BamC [Porticoccaceae bacterium]
MIRIVLVLSLVLITSGCTRLLGDNNPFRNRSNDYLQASSLEDIQVPENLDSQAVGQLYPVPEAGEVPDYQLDDEFVVPRVEANLNESTTSAVKIQRLAGESWILTSSPPGETWPRVRNFLANNELPTEFANAATGTIDTSWVELEEEQETVHQFRLKLEQGVQVNTTEIVIQHRQYQVDAMPAVLPEWTLSGSDNLEREDWLRNELAQSLAIDDVTSSASLLGQEIGAAVKVRLETPANENPYMLLFLNEERAWAAVTYALEIDTINLIERDDASDIADFEFYEVEPEDLSWFAKLRGRRNAEPVPYRLKMIEEEGDQVIRIFNLDDTPVDQREAFIVLTRLRANLS